jgi:hypothetical protein
VGFLIYLMFASLTGNDRTAWQWQRSLNWRRV